MPGELSHNLLRAYADGELSPEDARRVESILASDPRWQRSLTIEQQLRDRVHQIMSSASAAPTELRHQIVDELQLAQPDESIATQAAQRPVAAERPGVLALLNALLVGPRRVSFPAIAGVALLVGTVVLFGIFGPQIDQRSEPQHTHPGALLAAAAEHVSKEHDRCAGDQSAFADKLIAMTREDAALRLQMHLGVESISIFDLSDIGYHFIGVGACSMPGAAASAHLIYQREVPGQPQSMMSIFVAPNHGQFPAKCSEEMKAEGRWSGVCGGKGCTKTILHGEDDQLVYFLACGFRDQVKLVSETISEQLARRGR
jgi:hypothetical protein